MGESVTPIQKPTASFAVAERISLALSLVNPIACSVRIVERPRSRDIPNTKRDMVEHARVSSSLGKKTDNAPLNRGAGIDGRADARLGKNCYNARMKSKGPGAPGTAETFTRSTPAVHPIARGEGWSVSEIVCSAGPADRPYEERHEGFSIAAVLEGCFTYRSDRGASLLYPGALLLGKSRACYECGHEHSVGGHSAGVCVTFRAGGNHEFVKDH